MTENPQTPRPRFRTASLIVLTLDILGLLGLLYGFTVITHKFRHIFAELLEGRSLPALTQLVLSIPVTASAVFFMGAMAALIYKELSVANKTATLLVNCAVFVLNLLLFMVLVLALFGPLVVIIGSLQK